MTRKLTLEEGMNILGGGISKAMMILDGYPTSSLFTCEEYMKMYDCVYQMCVQQPPFEYSAELYEIFKKALEESITSRVIPAVKDKTQNFLLYEVWNMWTKYKVMAKFLGGFFLYLDRQVTDDKNKNTASLNELSVCCFRDMVVSELYPKIMEAAISLVNQDREGNSVDRDMLKDVSTLFVEIGSGKMYYYENFETAILASTANYYNHLLPQWLLHYSPIDIFMKAQNCLNQEKERASQFMHETSVEKLLQVVHEQLLGQTALDQAKQYEKQKNEYGDCSLQYQEMLSGCAGLNLGEGSSRV
ncbi:cullin-1-like isoform X1 [Bidens hawaiensis]|uniref:cullin-1-like isoform X1 n=1 Tax=Bidens hawaiensis TaxID=980011 RepID=UPI0040496724